MKYLFIILGIFIIFLSKATQEVVQEPSSITLCINNKDYDISIDPERPYTVWYSESEYYESYDLNEVIEYLYNLK